MQVGDFSAEIHDVLRDSLKGHHVSDMAPGISFARFRNESERSPNLQVAKENNENNERTNLSPFIWHLFNYYSVQMIDKSMFCHFIGYSAAHIPSLEKCSTMTSFIRELVMAG
jgi:hypothetical protein